MEPSLRQQRRELGQETVLKRRNGAEKGEEVVGQIETFYILNHSHTDIGFTDYQDLVFRQHAEFIDQAIDLCERTADYPQEAQYRWTCEVTGTTERYLETAGPAQLERFKKWHEMGRLDVGAMQYNFTPLLGVEQMYRSLLPVRRLRERWGLNVDTRHAVRRQRHRLAVRRPAPGHGGRFSVDVHQPGQGRRAQALPDGVLVGGAQRTEAAGLERVPLPVRAQRPQAWGLAFCRKRNGGLREEIGVAGELPVRLPVLPVDPPDAGGQRPSRPRDRGLRPKVERTRQQPSPPAGRPPGICQGAEGAGRRAPGDAGRVDGLVVRRGRFHCLRDGRVSPVPPTARHGRDPQHLGQAEGMGSGAVLAVRRQLDLRAGQPVRRAHLGCLRQRGRAPRPLDQGTGKRQGWLCLPGLGGGSRHAGQGGRQSGALAW